MVKAKNINKKNDGVKEQLKEDFLEGERYTVDEIIKKYYTPNSQFTYLKAKDRVKQLLGQIRQELLREGEAVFGSLFERHYGIANTEEEVAYILNRSYLRSRGASINSERAIQIAKEQGVMPKKAKQHRLTMTAVDDEDN